MNLAETHRFTAGRVHSKHHRDLLLITHHLRSVLGNLSCRPCYVPLRRSFMRHAVLTMFMRHACPSGTPRLGETRGYKTNPEPLLLQSIRRPDEPISARVEPTAPFPKMPYWPKLADAKRTQNPVSYQQIRPKSEATRSHP